MATYEKRETGWQVRFSVSPYKRKALCGFKTKKEAEQAMQQYLLKADEYNADSVYFDYIVAKYKEYIATRFKQTSYDDVCRKIDKHILPTFTGQKMASIKAKDVLAWQETLSSYSYEYKSALRSWLSSIYIYAEKYYDVRNIMKNVDTFKKPIKDTESSFNVWTPEEFSQFIACVEDKTMHCLFNFIFYTGCRRGEALALMWDCVSGNKVTIKRNRVGHGKEMITTPKNQSSVRTISVDQSIIDEMQSIRCGDYVFGGDTYLSPTTITRYFDKAIEQSGVKKIRIHDLRHSHASMLLSSGASVVAVAKRLGHSNIEMTLNTYAHCLPNDNAQIDNIISGKKVANKM